MTKATFNSALYELAAVKGFKGHEGEPLQQGNLKLNGKKVAEWSEDFQGGCLRIDFDSKAASQAFLDWALEFNSKEDYIEHSFKRSDEDLKSYPESVLEWVMYEMISRYNLDRDIKRLTKDGKLAIEYRPTPSAPQFSHKQVLGFKSLFFCQEHLDKAAKEYPVPEGFKVVVYNELAGQKLMTLAEVEQRAKELGLDSRSLWFAKYKKKCATHTLYLVKNDKGEEKLMARSEPFSEAVAKMLELQYGSNLLEIVNRRFR